MVAAQMATDAYPIIDYANIKIDAKIVGMGDLDIQPGKGEVSIDNMPETEENEKAKRRIINGITQGASIRGAFGFMLFKEYLDQINPALVDKYNEILKLAFGIYDDENAIAMMLAALAQMQKMQGGESEMEYDEENDQFVIKAKAICFPMLVHEIVKGLYEIVGTEGFGADKEKNQAIVSAVDKLSNEPRDLQYGKFIYDAISALYNESDIDDPRVRELFFAEVYKLPDFEFFPFIENAINGELKLLQKKWAIDTMRDIKRDLMKDDTGLSDLDEINFKQAIVAAGITLGSLLGTPGVQANIPSSFSKVATSISTVNAKSDIEKVIKGFEKEGYNLPMGISKDAKIQSFKGLNEDSIKIQSFKGQTEAGINLSIREFARANNINLMKSIIMINSSTGQGVLIYSTTASL